MSDTVKERQLGPLIISYKQALPLVLEIFQLLVILTVMHKSTARPHIYAIDIHEPCCWVAEFSFLSSQDQVPSRALSAR